MIAPLLCIVALGLFVYGCWLLLAPHDVYIGRPDYDELDLRGRWRR